MIQNKRLYSQEKDVLEYYQRPQWHNLQRNIILEIIQKSKKDLQKNNKKL